MSLTVLDLFSGSGGFSRGFEKAGFKTTAFCEIDTDCQKILKQHWPDAPIYPDIKNLSGERLKKSGIENIDAITGGFPCTDLSIAGQQKGINENTRSGLWWEMRRLISEIRPKFAVMENVPALLSGERGRWFGQLLGSLAEIGYDAEWCCISAAAVGKTHLRERVWIVAYPHGFMRGNNQKILKENMLSNDCNKQSKSSLRGLERARRALELLPKYLRVDDGVPLGLDEITSRVKACGNSIVPEIAYLIAKKIQIQLSTNP